MRLLMKLLPPKSTSLICALRREAREKKEQWDVLEEDVLGLEVAVHDVVGVDELQRLQNLLDDDADPRQREIWGEKGVAVQLTREVVQTLLQQLGVIAEL